MYPAIVFLCAISGFWVRHRQLWCLFHRETNHLLLLTPGGRYLTLMTPTLLHFPPIVGSLLHSYGWVHTRVWRTILNFILQLLSILFCFVLTGPHCGALAGLKLRTMPAEFQGLPACFRGTGITSTCHLSGFLIYIL